MVLYIQHIGKIISGIVGFLFGVNIIVVDINQTYFNRKCDEYNTCTVCIMYYYMAEINAAR